MVVLSFPIMNFSKSLHGHAEYPIHSVLYLNYMQGSKDSPHFHTRGKGRLGKAKSEGTIFRPSWPSEKIGLLCFLIVLEKNLSLYELVYIDNSGMVK